MIDRRDVLKLALSGAAALTSPALAQTVNIRYEFRPQLVRLGILPPVPTADPLQRRERALGFEPGFSPEPPLQR